MQWIVISIYKHEERKKKHSLMAQTTSLASFGPVFTNTAFPEPLRSFNLSIEAVDIV